MLKIRSGDRVIVMTGKDKGKKGTVLKVLKGINIDKYRVIVEGVNIIKKHVKGNPSKGTQGEIIEKESSLHYSNVLIINSVTGKPDKVGFKVLENGKKVRIFKSNGEIVVDG